MPLKILKNGHTVQVGLEGVGAVNFHGDEYKLPQFHFHAPGEHAVQGKSYDREVHLVHKRDKSKLAVLGVFMKPGKQNAVAEADGEAEVQGASINPQDLLLSGKDSKHSIGSLTAPPRFEGGRRNVLTDIIEVSQMQNAAFKALYATNARPV